MDTKRVDLTSEVTDAKCWTDFQGGTKRVETTTHYPVTGRAFVDEVFNQLWACGYTSATECEPFINEIRTGEYNKMIIRYGSHFVKWVIGHTLAPNGSRPSIRTLTSALRGIKE